MMSTESAAAQHLDALRCVFRAGSLRGAAPWLMIAAWIALVGVLTVAFPPLTKVVEGQTAAAAAAQSHGGR